MISDPTKLQHADGSESTVDVGRRMMAFNWLPAAYAHSDWLGPWAELLKTRDLVSTRVLQRASVSLIDKYDLRTRYVRDIGAHGWLLHPHVVLSAIASALGVAMLGGWVRGRLERREVERQQLVLGTVGRNEALRYAHELHALPIAPSGQGWPVELNSSNSVIKLGISCLVALLTDTNNGSRERFTLRFAHGHVVPLVLTERQRSEARSLITTVEDTAVRTTGGGA